MELILKLPCDPQKSRRRRNRKKKKKKNQEKSEDEEGKKSEGDKDKGKDSEVEIEYVTEEPEIYDPNYIFFKRIFEAFKVRVCSRPAESMTRMMCSRISGPKDLFNGFLSRPLADRRGEEREGEGAREGREAGDHLV